MQEERHFSFADFRKKVLNSLSKIFAQFGLVKDKVFELEKHISLLLTEQLPSSISLREIKKFYENSDEEKLIFFHLLAEIEPSQPELLFNQIYAYEDTPQWLINLREDLLNLKDRIPLETFKKLDGIFKDYFSKIFNFQYLKLKVCDPDTTSIKLLKYIAEKEGVHPSKHWWNFERRLQSPDRILLALEHFKMSGVPVVYVEIALSKSLVRKTSQIFEREKPVNVKKADTAIFYSINTTFRGLSGAGLGRRMIIKAKEYLKSEYPQIRLFATLSPLPKFRFYLETILKNNKRNSFRLKREDIDKNLYKFFKEKEIQKLKDEILKEETLKDIKISDLLEKILKKENWWENSVFFENLKKPMEKIVLFYIKNERRKNSANTFDPVANFHLSNGASLGGINFCANLTEKGLKESYGMMVNYIYDEKTMETNKLKYSEGIVVIKLL